MKQWIQIVLVMSLAFNFGFLGMFVYRLIERPSRKEEIRPAASVYDARAPLPGDRARQPIRKPVLNAEQKRELRRIREAYKSEIQSMRQSLLRERRRLGGMLLNHEADSAKIGSQIQTIGELEIRMEKAIVFELIRESRILAPEERAAFIRMALQRLDGTRKRPQNASIRPRRSDRIPEKPKQRRTQP